MAITDATGYKSSLTKVNEDLIVSSEKPKSKAIKFTPQQAEALDELADTGLFKPFGVSKYEDPDAVYEYADFSDFVRQMIAQVYKERTGKDFPPDPIRGNPNF